MTTTPLLDLRAVSIAHNGVPAVHQVSFALQRGETIAILGPNGAGKTTLMRGIMGLLPLQSGQIILGGAGLDGLSVEKRARRGLAYCPDGRRIFPGLTVRENLEVASYRKARKRRRLIDHIVALFPQLGDKLHSRAWQLSGGQQQMLAIGRALMSEPQVLLLDEPSMGLAGTLIEEVIARLRDLSTHGTTILLAEQNVHAALQIAQNIIVLRRGMVVWTATGLDADRSEIEAAILGD